MYEPSTRSSGKIDRLRSAYQALQQGSRCPLCRVPINATAISFPPLALNSLVDNLLVRCTACGAHMKRARFENHSNQDCKVPCPLGCGVDISRAARAAHEEECTAKIVPCTAQSVGCGFSAARAVLADHLRTCPFVAASSVLRDHFVEVKVCACTLSGP